MAATTALGPDGREWRVERVWMKRRPRWFRSATPKFDSIGNPLRAADGCFDLEDLVYLIAIVAVVAALWFFILPALLFVFDLLFLLLTAAFGIAFRILFRRPWHVVAETDGPPHERVDLPVIGFRASGDKVEELSWNIRQLGSPLGSA